MSKNKETQTKKLKISVSNIEDALASFLIATGVVKSHQDILNIDIPLHATKDGLVNVELTVLSL